MRDRLLFTGSTHWTNTIALVFPSATYQTQRWNPVSFFIQRLHVHDTLIGKESGMKNLGYDWIRMSAMITRALDTGTTNKQSQLKVQNNNDICSVSSGNTPRKKPQDPSKGGGVWVCARRGNRGGGEKLGNRSTHRDCGITRAKREGTQTGRTRGRKRWKNAVFGNEWRNFASTPHCPHTCHEVPLVIIWIASALRLYSPQRTISCGLDTSVRQCERNEGITYTTGALTGYTSATSATVRTLYYIHSHTLLHLFYFQTTRHV